MTEIVDVHSKILNNLELLNYDDLELIYNIINEDSNDQSLNLTDCPEINSKYELVRLLGVGAYGKVYEACMGKDCKYALKITRIRDGYTNTIEPEISKIAGDINIGPKVYDYGDCKNLTTNTKWILMDKIIGKRLSETYPYDSNIIKMSLEKYYKLFKQAGILQNDLKGDNILIDNFNNVYIIDYGEADYKDRDIAYKHMSEVIILLIKSLTVSFENYSDSPNLWGQDSAQSKFEMLKSVYNTCNDWFISKFSKSLRIYIYVNITKFKDNDSDVVDKSIIQWLKEKLDG